MSIIDSMIEDAMARARSRVVAEPVTAKTASVQEDDLIKTASEVANALEYVSLATANDGSPAGEVREGIVRDFFKAKTAAEGGPAESSAQASGGQAQPPVSSKKKIQPAGKPGDVKPSESEALEGAMSREVMSQPVAKSADSGTSLYDILMNGQADEAKEAAGGGPAECGAGQDARGIPSANENANRQSLLGSNEAPVSATKRQAKKPTRARLAELFSSAGDTAGDTTGDATAKAVWPQAASKGDIKVADKEMSVAELARAFRQEGQ